MEYKIVNKDGFKIIAKIKMFNEENSTKGIPAYWDEYFSMGLGNKVPAAMGICAQEIIGSKEFKYGIGCEASWVKEIPEGFEILEIPAHTWAIFTCIGAMPDAIQNMWKRIYSEWLPQAAYELISDYDIEFYTEGDTQSANYSSEIWIPVKEK